jgi:hypothetical protein
MTKLHISFGGKDKIARRSRAKIARAKHRRGRRPSVKMALRVGGGTRSATTFETQSEFFRKESTIYSRAGSGSTPLNSSRCRVVNF